MEDDLEGIEFNIRACIMSSKGLLPVRNLNRDYETLVGSPIPYRQLKYQSLESFLQSFRSLHVFNRGVDMMVEAAVDRSSAHISSMIAKQKSVKKKDYFPSRRGRPPHKPQGWSRELPPRFNSAAENQPPRRYPERPTQQLRVDNHSPERPKQKNTSNDWKGRQHSPERLEPRQPSMKTSHDWKRREFSPERPAPKHHSMNTSHDWKGRQHSPERLEPRQHSINTSHDWKERQHSPGPTLPTFNTVQTSQARRGFHPSSDEQLRIKLEANDRRQVSIEGPGTSKPLSSSAQKSNKGYEMPPRLQKLQQIRNYLSDVSMPMPSTSVNSASQSTSQSAIYSNHDVNNVDSDISSSKIVAPRGPRQLIEDGRAKMKKAAYTYDHLVPTDPLMELNTIHGDLVQEEKFVTVPPVPVGVEEYLLENINLLEKYCSARGWCMPEYKVLTRHATRSRSLLYGATVTVNTTSNVCIINKCSSYPHEYDNPNEARGRAALTGLDLLRQEEEMKLPKANVTKDNNAIWERVTEIVADAFTGIFAKKVEQLYSEKYQECLPDDWVLLLATCPTVTVEAAFSNSIVFPRNPSQDPVLKEPAPVLGPPPLQLPPGDVWDVYVTCATSTRNVWFRLIGEEYSEKYEELLMNMDCYYREDSTSKLAQTVEEGHYYAAYCEGGWLRVFVNQVKDFYMVTAWLIDHGESDTFQFGNLFILPPEFCVLPGQVAECSLEGLESLSEDPYARDLVANSDDLIGKILIAQLTLNDPQTGLIKVIMYDTSGTDDVNVNEKLHDCILYTKATPDLPNDGYAMEVYIGTVTSRGEVYVQMPGSTFSNITEILDSLTPEEISHHKLTSYRQIELDKLYLAKYSKDDSWYRAKITTQPSFQQNKVAVHFVDFGNSETVSITDIAVVDNLPTILRKHPHQALKVALHNLPVETLSNTEVAKLHALLMDQEKVVLLKTVEKQKDPPIVDIFYKNDADDSALISVNNTIAIARTMSTLNGYKSSLNSSNPVNGQGRFELKVPKLDDCEFLSLMVVQAAHPGNFIFQPLKYKKDIVLLQKQLQAFYNATTFPEVKEEHVVIGGTFAVWHSADKSWFRAIVTGSVLGSMVPVQLCDYGDVMCVSLSDMRELETEFRHKPIMAFKGKLAGVVPKHTDWSVEDCIRFQELVVSKTFASSYIHIEELGPGPFDQLVSLNLVDTNSDEDIVVADILVRENRAIKEQL